MERKYGKWIDLGAYINVVMTANQDKLNKEDYLMLTARTRKILEEIGWAEQWSKKSRLEGKLEGKLEDARAMLAEGDSLTKIARVTGISLKTLKAKLSV